MNPYCFLLRFHEKHAWLYVLELSTVDGVAMFDGGEAVQIKEFEADPNGRDGWISLSDLPLVQNVEELNRLLLANDDWNLVDVTVAVGDDSELSTHDDGECHFRLKSEQDVIVILERLLGARALNVFVALKGNQGRYVVLEPDGGWQIYETFEAFLSREEKARDRL